jgi:hypothetical protein
LIELSLWITRQLTTTALTTITISTSIVTASLACLKLLKKMISSSSTKTRSRMISSGLNLLAFVLAVKEVISKILIYSEIAILIVNIIRLLILISILKLLMSSLTRQS